MNYPIEELILAERIRALAVEWRHQAYLKALGAYTDEINVFEPSKTINYSDETEAKRVERERAAFDEARARDKAEAAFIEKWYVDHPLKDYIATALSKVEEVAGQVAALRGLSA